MTTPDYLKQAQEQLDGKRYATSIDWSVHTTALATMGILQQLTRIADMMEADRRSRRT